MILLLKCIISGGSGTDLRRWERHKDSLGTATISTHLL